MQREGIEFSITNAKTAGANIPIMSLKLMTHHSEEAATLLILHALNAAKDNSYKEYIVLSFDTDVFSTFNLLLPISSLFSIFRN